MSRVAAIFALAAMIAAPAFAAFNDVDTDGDSLVSMAELTAVYPDVTEELFGEIDANDDGMIDDAEMTAAIEAELLPATE